MFHNQLRKTTKPYRCLFDLTNIHKLKVEHLISIRLVHKLRKDYENRDRNVDIKFPFQNIQKIGGEPRYSQCMRKPLSIKHQMTNSIRGNRMYLEKYPSVTTILSNTKPRNEFFGLMNWRKSNISKFGEEKFGLMQRDIFMKGTTFHQDMKEYFAESTSSTHHKIHTSGFVKSVCNILPNISNPLAVESSVVHSGLAYAGTIDLVAEYMGKLSVIDWKTSQKKKVDLTQCHSYPIQVLAYAGAINFDPDYPFQISNCVLVIAYENGDPADVLIINEELCDEYWEKWLARLHQYKAMSLDEKVPQEPLCEEPQNNELRQNLKSFSIMQPISKVKQNGGKLLNEIGRTVKDEEVVATWRNLKGLTESILGRVLISKVLLMTHYVANTLKSILKKMLDNTSFIIKKENQFPKENIRKNKSI